MAAKPLTFLEKKWATGYTNNRLVTGATQTSDRPQVPMADRDTHRNITSYGRRTLLTLGRSLYWNVSAVRGAINEMTELAVQSFIPQFEGADQAWGSMVEEWLREHDRICDVRGYPFDMASYRRNLIRSTLIDGDTFTLLTETDTGYPMIQVIPGHRVGNGTLNDSVVEGGTYDGARIIDGVIVDDLGRAIAYRVYGENGSTFDVGDFRDISARDMFPSFIIETPDQLRGYSALGCSVFDWQDVKQARAFELIAQKLGASIGLIETNESGEADKTKKMLSRDEDNFTDNDITTTATETVDGVSIRYMRAGSGSKLEAYKNDRPTVNQQMFRDDVIREALNGIGWSFDYSYNPTKIGGASMRVVVDRLNRKLEGIRCDLVEKAMRRIDGWRVAKVMENPARTDKLTTLFPFNVDWWRWSYQGPAVLTADAKYNSDVDLQERKSGMKTLAKSTAERGDDWRDIRAQCAKEADDLLTRATELATKHGVTKELAITLLQDTASYSTVTNPTPSSADNNPSTNQDVSQP